MITGRMPRNIEVVLNKPVFNAFLFGQPDFSIMVVSLFSGMNGKGILRQVRFQFDSLSRCVCDVQAKSVSLIVPAAMDNTLYAVASEGASPESRVSDKAARAPCYLIFDARGDFLETIANPLTDVSRGAAPQAVELLAMKGVGFLIAARFGKKMLYELAAAGIRHKESRGDAGHVVRAFLNCKE
jgi:predicted Fe-Mo cluster-binding NifX family protein